MEIVDRIVTIVLAARAKHRIEELLAAAKDGAPKNAFRTRGTAEQIRGAVHDAVRSQHLTVDQLGQLVDEIEENGRQHIFLFRLTESGARHCARDPFSDLPRVPADRTAFYSEQPTNSRLYRISVPGSHRVKQLRSASYFVVSEEESQHDSERQVTVRVSVRVRCVNLAIIRPEARELEIRVARVSEQPNDDLAYELYSDFLERLSPYIDFSTHVEVEPIWNGFNRIAEDETEVLLSTDRARDAQATVSFTSVREPGKRDIRKHPHYFLKNRMLYRDFVNAYWVPRDGIPLSKPVHTRLHRFVRSNATRVIQLAKVYVAAHVSARELDYVLSRVRAFAR